MSTEPQLPADYHVRPVGPEDLDELEQLVRNVHEVTRGRPTADVEAIRAIAVGIGSWTRRQRIVTDDGGRVVAWAGAHDRAAGRTDLTLIVDRRTRQADVLAARLLDWLDRASTSIASGRDENSTRLELSVDADDSVKQSWAGAHGMACARTWLQMQRPVAAGEPLAIRDGVTVRRVRTHDLGDGTTMPVAEDLQAVHRVLEHSFADHFNSYRESFGEFVQRLREDPGHRWDHWWLADVNLSGAPLVAGALVSTVLAEDPDGFEGSYIDYIGVDQQARGRGVAKALLATVINDAARRGRNRVGLEVDADSPTGANGLYESMGWRTAYVTQSWTRDLAVATKES